MSDPNFGERMRAVRAERGLRSTGGRRRIIDKYRGQTGAAERTFANALPVEAQRYVDELAPKEPEMCPLHDRVLQCPEDGCTRRSERTYYDHRAAAYVFDRIMGKPTTRSENVITVRLVEHLTTAFLLAFGEINGLGDASARSEALAQKLRLIGAQYSGSTTE